jgi:hypothetical protein
MKIASTEKNQFESIGNRPGGEWEQAMRYVRLGERLAELLAAKVFQGAFAVLVLAIALVAVGLGFFSATSEERATVDPVPSRADSATRFQDPRESD